MTSSVQPTEGTPLDPAESLKIIADQRRKVASRGPDPRVLYGAWGAAWLGGYLLFHQLGHPIPAWAIGVFSALMGSAMAITIVHSAVTTRGVRGVSAQMGARYGWSWFISFAAFVTLMAGLSNAGASPETLALVGNAVPCLIVGIQYMAGGNVFNDTSMYIAGVWFIAVAGVACFVSIDIRYLVMALLGGGGLLVMAGITQLRSGK